MKIESLQVLRGLAFIEIFLYHCGIPYFTGCFGVSIFFVLSGFCFGIKYFDNYKCTVGITFSINRIIKLYPLHLIILIGLYVLSNFSNTSYFLIDAFLLQSLIPKIEIYYSFNGVAWYLSSYMIILLIFPLFIELLNKKHNKLLIYLILVYFSLICLGVRLSLVDKGIAKYVTYICPLCRLFDVIVGYYVYIMYRGLDSTRIKIFVILLALALSFCAILLHHNTDLPIGIRYNFVFTIPSTCIILSFAFANNFIKKSKQAKLVQKIGNYSAVSFLIHQVCIGYCKRISNYLFEENSTRQLFSCIVAFCVTITLAVVYKYGEKRLQAYLINKHRNNIIVK